MDPDDIRRRLKAARALTVPSEYELEQRSPRTRNAETGITVEELARRVNEPGLGWKTIGAIERGERTAQRRDLIVIAEAVDVPPEFFAVSPLELYQRIAGAAVPGIPGATGRRVSGLRPNPGDPEQRENPGAEERSREEL